MIQKNFKTVHFDLEVDESKKRRRSPRTKAFSSIENVPSEMIAKSYSLFPTKRFVNAERYRNDFLVTAIEKHLETCVNIEATFQIYKKKLFKNKYVHLSIIDYDIEYLYILSLPDFVAMLFSDFETFRIFKNQN